MYVVRSLTGELWVQVIVRLYGLRSKVGYVQTDARVVFLVREERRLFRSGRTPGKLDNGRYFGGATGHYGHLSPLQRCSVAMDTARDKTLLIVRPATPTYLLICCRAVPIILTKSKMISDNDSSAKQAREADEVNGRGQHLIMKTTNRMLRTASCDGYPLQMVALHAFEFVST